MEQPRRLASLGLSEYRQQDWKTKRMEVVEVELFVDVDHPAQRYFRTPRDVLQPMHDTSGKEDEVVSYGPVSSSLRAWRSGTYPESPPDPAPRPV